MLANRVGQSLEEVEKEAKLSIPAGRYGKPEEFASVVTFLSSDAASYITGSMIRVDGGLTKGLQNYPPKNNLPTAGFDSTLSPVSAIAVSPETRT